MAARSDEEAGARTAVTIASVAPAGQSLGFVCPRCRGALASGGDRYECVDCRTSYPVVLGIPDFRVFPDPWIGFDDDREKARALEERSRGMSLEDMVGLYWSMTPATPAEQAARFVRHVMSALDRSREWLAGIDSRSVGNLPWLDVGAGTGDLACAAASHGVRIVGVDIAMRWLVVARRRAELAGLAVDLVCCNAEHLPFADRAFARVVSLGTIEHCVDAQRMLDETRRVLARGGDAHIRTVNRFTLLAEPHVGVWGVGFLPRKLADRYVRWRTGQGYAHHRPLSPREMRRALQRAGFASVSVEAAAILAAERPRVGGLQWAARAYEIGRGVPGARAALRWATPLLEATGVAA